MMEMHHGSRLRYAFSEGLFYNVLPLTELPSHAKAGRIGDFSDDRRVTTSS